MSLIHKLRDLDAFLTSYGQCVRCRRSWRYASHVTVGHAIRSAFQRDTSYFCLCIKCFLREKSGPSAGLVLQGWAYRAMAEQEPRAPDVRRRILEAYGMAYRFPIELETGWSSGPDTYRVRVIDERRRNRMGRADLSPTGEKVDLPPSDPAPPSVIGWTSRFIHQRCMTDHLPTETCPADGLTGIERARLDGAIERLVSTDEPEPPGWDGAGNDVEAQRG